MKKLTTKDFWDNVWQTDKNKIYSRSWKKLVAFLKKLMGEKWKNYSEYILWNRIYKDFLPQQTGLKILEIGSAPGWNLIKFHKNFGYDPFGLEYSPVGAEENRRRFAQAGLNRENVIEDNFFSASFHEKFKERFDLVMSGGFIEHFDDVNLVIDKHLDLLKKEGIIIVTVPNFQGLNYYLFNFFYKGIIKTHNCNIMKLERFSEIFKRSDLKARYCGYFGTLYLPLYMFDYENNGKIKFIIYRLLVRFQTILNYFFHILFKNRGAESKYFSPYMIYLGQKL